VSQGPKDIAASERARWLAEVSKALDDAHRLASELGIPQLHNVEAVELCARIAAARAQAKGLRLGRAEEDAAQLGPKWSSLVWPKRAGDERP